MTIDDTISISDENNAVLLRYLQTVQPHVNNLLLLVIVAYFSIEKKIENKNGAFKSLMQLPYIPTILLFITHFRCLTKKKRSPLILIITGTYLDKSTFKRHYYMNQVGTKKY